MHKNSSQGVHTNLLNYLRLSKETEGNLFQFGFFGEKLIDLPVELNCLFFRAYHKYTMPRQDDGLLLNTIDLSIFLHSKVHKNENFYSISL